MGQATRSRLMQKNPGKRTQLRSAEERASAQQISREQCKKVQPRTDAKEYDYKGE